MSQNEPIVRYINITVSLFRYSLSEDINMADDKRKTLPPIPDDYENLLTPLQLMALRNIASFGWELRFVRREGLDMPIPVVHGADGKKIGVIEADGNINLNSTISLRDEKQ